LTAADVDPGSTASCHVAVAGHSEVSQACQSIMDKSSNAREYKRYILLSATVLRGGRAAIGGLTVLCLNMWELVRLIVNLRLSEVHAERGIRHG
jgi:hypothetical protein